MEALGWIITSGLIMCLIAMVGSVVFFMTEATFQKVLLPLVALSAGTLIGGAFLHMIPEGLEVFKGTAEVFFLWLLAGFLSFFAPEELPSLLRGGACGKLAGNGSRGGVNGSCSISFGPILNWSESRMAST